MVQGPPAARGRSSRSSGPEYSRARRVLPLARQERLHGFMGEFRWYRGEIRPEAEEASGLFYYMGIAEPLQTENSGATQCVGTHGNLIPPINEEDGEHEAI